MSIETTEQFITHIDLVLLETKTDNVCDTREIQSLTNFPLINSTNRI